MLGMLKTWVVADPCYQGLLIVERATRGTLLTRFIPREGSGWLLGEPLLPIEGSTLKGDSLLELAHQITFFVAFTELIQGLTDLSPIIVKLLRLGLNRCRIAGVINT